MRMSSDENDPGFPTWNNLGEAKTRIKAFLDGVESKGTVTADEELGFVYRAKLNVKGEIYAVGNEVAMETVSGVVRIELPTEAAK